MTTASSSEVATTYPIQPGKIEGRKGSLPECREWLKQNGLAPAGKSWNANWTSDEGKATGWIQKAHRSYGAFIATVL